MRSFDFSPYRRSTIGFDRLFDFLETAARSDAFDNFPPFDIEKRADDQYRIILAVAGFRQDELEVTTRQNMLTISGRRNDASGRDGDILHSGIGGRAFERRFELADFMRVEKADLRDGLLTIDLIRELPEGLRPRKIAINGGSSHTIEGSAVERIADRHSEERQPA